MAEQKKKPAKPERKQTHYLVYQLVEAGKIPADEIVLQAIGDAHTHRGPQHAATLALEAAGIAETEGSFKAVPASSAKTHKRTIKKVVEPRWEQEELS